MTDTERTTGAPEMGSPKTDDRTGARERDRALCCECGTLRTIATNYFGRTPDPRPEGRWLKWVKCATCRVVTTHAIIEDASTHWRPKGSTGCNGERDNLEQTKAQRELAPLLKRCEAAQMTIEWVDDLPRWEKRPHGWQQETIIAELSKITWGASVTWHVRIVEGQPATKTVAALRKVLTYVHEPSLIHPEKFYGLCGCGWDITVCSYCPGEGWRWNK